MRGSPPRGSGRGKRGSFLLAVAAFLVLAGLPFLALSRERAPVAFPLGQPGTIDALYVKAAANGVSLKSLLTVAEIVPLTRDPGKDYRMAGIPDGLSAYTDEAGPSTSS